MYIFTIMCILNDHSQSPLSLSVVSLDGVVVHAGLAQVAVGDPLDLDLFAGQFVLLLLLGLILLDDSLLVAAFERVAVGEVPGAFARGFVFVELALVEGAVDQDPLAFQTLALLPLTLDLLAGFGEDLGAFAVLKALHEGARVDVTVGLLHDALAVLEAVGKLAALLELLALLGLDQHSVAVLEVVAEFTLVFGLVLVLLDALACAFALHLVPLLHVSVGLHCLASACLLM
mmetsp:Transcript_52837/g.115426  ORF Transcript_52837/g.115426 Transcript_52837/m.115426 type:complete len:231 (-) Transcript_52837:93-785(-)